MQDRFEQIRIGAGEFKEYLTGRQYLARGASTALIVIGLILIGWGLWTPIQNYQVLQENAPPPALPPEALPIDENIPLPEGSGEGVSLADNPLPVFEPQPPTANKVVPAAAVIPTESSVSAPTATLMPVTPTATLPQATASSIGATATAALAAATATETATPASVRDTETVETEGSLLENPLLFDDAPADTLTPTPTEEAVLSSGPGNGPLFPISMLTAGQGLPTPTPGGPLALAPTATPRPTFTPTPGPFPPAETLPNRIVVPAIGLDSDVVEVGWGQAEINGQLVSVWNVAEYAAGWHQNSALPGHTGNIVLSGHHNILGEVFRYTVDLEVGDLISLYTDEFEYQYRVEDKFIVKDKGEPTEVRRANARWIGPFSDQRLTMITCWPYNNNTHRVIVVAKPFVERALSSSGG